VDDNLGKLILSRRVGEVFTIGNNIRVAVLGIHGEYVRLGFDAPKDIPIVRSELLKDGPWRRAT
jgi:carbon storage regulator